MEWQEAMNVLEAVKGRYQAFEKLQDVARLLATHEQAAREAKAQAEDLDRQLTQRRKVIQSMQERETALSGTIKDLESKYLVQQRDWETKIKQLKEEYRAGLEALEADHKALGESLEREHQVRKTEMEKELAALSKESDRLSKQIEDFKKRITGL